MIRMLIKLLTRHLSTKLIVMMLSLLIVFITVTSYLYERDTNRLITSHIRENTINHASQMGTYFDLIALIGENMGKQIARDATLQSILQKELTIDSVDERYELKTAVDQTLNHWVYTNSFINSIYILKDEGSSWGSGQFNISKVRRYSLNQHDWYNLMLDNKLDERWLPLQNDPFSGGGSDADYVLTYLKALKDISTGNTIGVIVINLDGKLVLDLVKTVAESHSGHYFIIKGQHELLISDETQPIINSIAESASFTSMQGLYKKPQEQILTLDKQHYFIVTEPIRNDWLVVGAVPLNNITENIQQTQQRIWGYTIVLLIVAVIVTLLFSKKITNPLNQLMAQMNAIEANNLNVAIEVRSRDEIGLLSHKFNKMMNQINTLVAELTKEQAVKRDAEIRALRHQIQPHFLYNTLSTIRWMVKLKQNDQAYHGISSLVQLMESSMGKTGPTSTIGKELDLLEKYMVIQRLRYGEHLHMTIDCKPSLQDVIVPRMLLQPIVENAVFHGLAPKEVGGTITITIDDDRQYIYIKIADDGVGMSEDIARGLLTSSHPSNKGLYGIGVSYVHETIQLYFGATSGIIIESEIDKGTTITLKLHKGVAQHAL